jgi:hypothetical protein
MEPPLVSDEPCRCRNRRDNPEPWPTNGASNHGHFWLPLLFGQKFRITCYLFATVGLIVCGPVFTSSRNGVLDAMVWRTRIREGKAPCPLFLVFRQDLLFTPSALVKPAVWCWTSSPGTTTGPSPAWFKPSISRVARREGSRLLSWANCLRAMERENKEKRCQEP